MVEEESTLTNLIFSKTWACKWLKWNNYINKFLHGGAGNIDKAANSQWIAEITLTLRMCTIWKRLA